MSESILNVEIFNKDAAKKDNNSVINLHALAFNIYLFHSLQASTSFLSCLSIWFLNWISQFLFILSVFHFPSSIFPYFI